MRAAPAVALLVLGAACSGTTAGEAAGTPSGTPSSAPIETVDGLQCMDGDDVLGASAEVGGPGLPSVRQAAATAFQGLALDFGGLESDSDGLVWRRDGRVVARAEVIRAPGGGWHGVGAKACAEVQATR